ncbi:MAG: hypothetical protein CAF45_004030 [Nitrospira sp. CG24E]|nr:MAG: hypothetical protein CAF45_004030 [Nitrospira sp. CG24E]
MSGALLSAVVFSAALMNVEADSLPFLDPPSPWWPSYSYAFRGGNSILREQGEKLLLQDYKRPGYSAYAIIALIDFDYEGVRDTLRLLVRERWGIVEEQDNSTGPIRDDSTMYKAEGYHSPINIINDNLRWPILGQGLTRLAGPLASGTAREYQLTSQPYNKIESLNGFSQVVIRVSDGNPLFDYPVTILQLTRTDRSREWARTHDFHGVIPLPYKEEWWSVGIVTSSEIDLIEELKRSIPGISVRYFVVSGGFLSDLPEERLKNVEAIRKKMEEVVEQLNKR